VVSSSTTTSERSSSKTSPPPSKPAFTTFSGPIAERFRLLSEHELYVVDFEDPFASYLAAFPEGTNPIFRERTEFDCSCCKHFVRTIGPVVAIIDGKIQTVWDVEVPYPYDVVAKTMADLVRQQPIKTVFRTKFQQFGNEFTIEKLDDGTRRWNHFVGRVASKHYSPDPATVRGDLDTNAQVLKRALEELDKGAVETVMDLITSGSLYRGEEHLPALQEFRNLQNGYDGSSTYVWAHLGSRAARFRNTVIGTLVTDLSEGVDLEKAVRSFETKVAPQNYKRTSALITPKMVEAAMQSLRDLGLEDAIDRRFAKITDVSVNNVLFVDNSVRGKMKGGIEGLLMDSVKPKPVNKDKAVPISAQDFLDKVVPQAGTIELLLENKLLPNFVSLTAPVHENTGRLFKWDNDFAWSYDGEVTDSIKEKVKRAGGNVTNAALRVSLAWFNYDDLDLHARCPDGHVFFGEKMMILDVDMNAGSGHNSTTTEQWTRTYPFLS
jgi:hypothetical protein